MKIPQEKPIDGLFRFWKNSAKLRPIINIRMVRVYFNITILLNPESVFANKILLPENKGFPGP
jgi:hypothetical protein